MTTAGMDISRELTAEVQAAIDSRQPVYITAGNSKQHMVGRDCAAQTLDVSGHTGIVDYQPGELVLTARAGTALTLLADVLAQEGQMLPFEPPLFDGRATLGGTLACNLSGPGRPWYGSIRDAILGVQLINGYAQCLNFGGRVMKNVAGFDVSRLQAGALGTLGILTQVSLKVLPMPEQTMTLAYEISADRALQVMNQRAALAAPLSGACWFDGSLYLRLSGAAAAVAATARRWGGQTLGEDDAPWQAMGDMTLPFFTGGQALWRISCHSTSPLAVPTDRTLIDWGGAQRWLHTTSEAVPVQAMAKDMRGHACLFSGGDRTSEVRLSPDATQQRLHCKLKQAFDPHGIFNPGRLYSWL